MARVKKLNINRLLKKYNFKGSKELQKIAYREALKKANQIKKEAMDELNAHPVTKEIDAGPSATGSQLLGGRGNLFGFLGFNNGTQPVEIIRNVFDRMLTVDKRAGLIKRIANDKLIIEYKIQDVPTITDIYQLTPLTWSTKSWVKGIQRGITNYSQTIFKNSDNSRSGVALQTKRKIGFITFRPTPYIDQILKNARKKFR